MAQPALLSYGTAALSLMMLIVIAYLLMGQYTRKDTVSGVLRPDSGIIKLESNKVGVVQSILVSEGDIVAKNQPLVRLVSEKHSLKDEGLNSFLIREYKNQITAFEIQIKELKIKQELEVSRLDANKEKLTRDLKLLAKNRNLVEKRYMNSQVIYERSKKLSNSGYVSGIGLMDLENSLLAIEQQLLTLDIEKIDIEDELTNWKVEKNKLPILHAKEMRTLTTSLSQARQQLAILEQDSLSEIRATSDGVITNILIKEGQVTRNQEPLLSILPKGSNLEAVLYIPSSAAGFIESGLTVRMRFQAFPYQKFGVFEGRILELSTNVILPGEIDDLGGINMPVYRAIVSLPDQFITAYGKQFSLKAGMKIEADIIQDKRNLLQWLFDPVMTLKGSF